MIRETTSLWVLPIIPLIVASSTGGNMSRALMANSKVTLATITTVFALASLCVGMSLTLMIITLFLTRLIVHGPPAPQIVVSGFIITSPLGTGGLSLLVNGLTLADIFPETRTGNEFPRISLSGEFLYAICVAAAFIFWAMGACWILISIFTIVVVRRRHKVPFTLTYWGAVFPNGVYALCIVRLGTALESPFFNYLGVVWTGFVAILWVVAFVPTFMHTWDTSIFPESTPDVVDPRHVKESNGQRTASYHATHFA
ncbi:C4-dicarboxylate transporter/malic acid transporter [Coprinopsis marcescibilis]|uniref:C4-dicarboxylate transporter/malic acid transporter n=1 Tax=Coprinopsis marcescibilis TaxID=230819 RepID=A0A5C3KKU2_COPMA|nr:C4-dicarboxylate transporter/malic acid transporter [Coprinopsis marcescibilis]